MNKEEILKLRSEGKTYQAIASQLGLSRQRVHQLITGYTTYGNARIKHLVLKRNDWTCQNPICKEQYSKLELKLHHIDEDSNNNNLDNLTILCKNCHYYIHSILHDDERKKYTCKSCCQEFDYSQMNRSQTNCKNCTEKNKTSWSQNFNVCILCNKTDSRHQSKGRCNRCISKIKYSDPLYKEKIKLATKKWVENHKEKVIKYNRENSKAYYYANREKCLAKSREYARKNPDKIKEHIRKSNLKKKLRKLCLLNKPENNL